MWWVLTAGLWDEMKTYGRFFFFFFFPFFLFFSLFIHTHIYWIQDALNFDPLRFFNQPKPSPFVFTAFQAGPRICLGQNFAYIELKVFLAKVLLHYEFLLKSDADSVTYENALTLPVKNGLLVYTKELRSS